MSHYSTRGSVLKGKGRMMADKETTERILASMDQAAKEAKKDFENLPEEVKRLAADWVKK